MKSLSQFRLVASSVLADAGLYGNPHIAPSQCDGVAGRFDEREVASAATPRRGALLYKILSCVLVAVALGVFTAQ